MNYLASFLLEKRRAEKLQAPADKTDKTSSVSFVSESPSYPRVSFSSNEEAEIDRLANADGWKSITPADSIIDTCHNNRITLSLDQDGSLRIGKADGSGKEPALWPSLLMAIEAHLPAIIGLVAGRLASAG
jgi:hypothetical protein